MVAKTKWHSLRSVSKQLNRRGVGRSNLIIILKQEGIITKYKRPKPSLIKTGLFRVIEHLIKPCDGGMVQLNTIQVSDKGINYIQNVLLKRDVRINTCMLHIQKLAKSKKVFIRTKINAI